MKRLTLQILRLGMTVVIMSTMAAMIFSLRSENAELRGRLARAAVGAAANDPGTLATIRERTSVRKFDPAVEVDAATVEKILRAGMCAPSAMNRQPWELVVVRDPAQLGKLAAALPYSRVGNGARLALVVCGSLDNGLTGRAKEYWIQDCSAVCMNILLAAKALGLGAVWTGVYPIDDRVAAVRQLLGMPEGFAPLAVIPIGAPAENPVPKDKWNADKVHYDRW